MATNTLSGSPLTGLDAELASQPIAQTPRGGIETGFDGAHGTSAAQAPQAPGNPLEGMGPFLELEPEDVFRAVHNLVLRQERLAKNRLAIDRYWSHVKDGHGLFYRLEKVPDQDRYRCAQAPGTSALTLSPVPNKLADLCNKVVEALMQDPPAPDPKAENDAEASERAAEIAGEFLEQDGGENGTRDHRLFWYALDAASAKSSAFLHYWVDQTGNGSVPLQIKAHPQAIDVQNPLIGPDGTPTSEYILRYVTPDQQFTDDPSQADRQWLPKIRIDKLGREHVRTYPETADVSDAEMVIVLHHCTLGEAKRRWPQSVGQMDDSALGQLSDWTPPRYLVLLPPALRARWKTTMGDESIDPKGSASDERTMFYYACYRRATPDYPHGAQVFLSGANGGTLLDRDTLSALVPMPNGKGSDLRAMDIPVVQVELVMDADELDPMGKPLAARVGGSNEACQILATGFFEALDKILHPAVYTTVTSPVTGDDVANSRATGDHIQVLSKEDYPHYEQPPTIPANTLDVLEWNHEQMNSSMSTSKPAQGSDKQQEVSGVARQIAVQQANVAMSRFQQALVAAFERHWRIKCQLAMAKFTVPQMIRYEGEDGAYQQEWWTGTDFARITDVSMKAGSGTMMPPTQKVQYVSQLQQLGFMSPDEASDVARPTFAGTLGVPPDPQQQRIERQVGTWLKGPPNPDWLPQAQAFNQAKALADQQNAQAQQQYQQVVQQQQAHEQSLQKVSEANAIPHQPEALPAPPQLAQPIDPQTGQPLAPPWTPFQPLPMDDEPLIAASRQRRLSRLMATSRFAAQPPEWQAMVFNEYGRMRNAVAASQAPPPMPRGVNVDVKSDPSTVAQAEQAATHPVQQPKAA